MSASLPVLGIPVTLFDSYGAAVDEIRSRIHAHQKTFCVAVNPEKICRSRRDPGLKRALDRADIRICDGIGVALASLALHGKRLVQCTGIDLFLHLVRLSVEEHWRIFLLGASRESNAGACRALPEICPGVRISGHHDGFFEESEDVVAQINSSGAELLFVGMGSPRQEIWISDHLHLLRPSLCMGVGGSFDVLSGAASRAPAIFRRAGLEWLFRLLSNPRRLARQVVLPRFVVEVLVASVAARWDRQQPHQGSAGT